MICAAVENGAADAKLPLRILLIGLSTVPAGQIEGEDTTVGAVPEMALVSVALLLDGLGSVVSIAGVTVATLVTGPTVGVINALSVNSNAVPGGKVLTVTPVWKVLVVRPGGHTADGGPPTALQVTLSFCTPG